MFSFGGIKFKPEILIHKSCKSYESSKKKYGILTQSDKNLVLDPRQNIFSHHINVRRRIERAMGIRSPVGGRAGEGRGRKRGRLGVRLRRGWRGNGLLFGRWHRPKMHSMLRKVCPDGCVNASDWH